MRPNRANNSADAQRIGKAYAAYSQQPQEAPDAGQQSEQAEQEAFAQVEKAASDLVSAVSALKAALGQGEQEQTANAEPAGASDTGSPAAQGMP